MDNKNGKILLYLEEAALYNMVKEALLEDDSSNPKIKFIETYDENEERGILDNEILVLTLMIIPSVESTLNIVSMIKNSINKKVESKLFEHKINKRINIKFKISLPFFSYEKEETLTIDPVENRDWEVFLNWEVIKRKL